MKRWQKKEDDFLIENYQSMSMDELTRELHKSENAIRWRILSRNNQCKKSELI